MSGTGDEGAMPVTGRASSAPPLVSLWHPIVRADPYPYYRMLREADPVHWDARAGAWALTRYADVLTALRDPRSASGRIQAILNAITRSGGEHLRPLFLMLSLQLAYMDPPVHARYRRIVARALAPHVLDRIRARVQSLVDDCLDRAMTAGRMDIIRDLAYPLPATIIAEILGVPPEDRERLKQWSDTFAAFVGASRLTEARLDGALRSMGELYTYLRPLLREVRQHPNGTLLSALAAADDNGDRLDDDEVLANATFVLTAGHETTTNLIGNGLLALLRHPDQYALLRQQPERIENAVEEFLRYESPAQCVSRVVREDMELDGQRLRAGQPVVLFLGAANRDPAQFPDPDRLDITRDAQRHLAFGYGLHFCPGAFLARMESQIAITTVLRRCPDLRLERNALEWHDSIVFRGLTALPVRF